MPKRMLLGLLLVIAAIAALTYSQMREEPRRVSGYIEAYEVQIGSRVGGRVASVNVEEGEQLVAGQVAIELEPFDLLRRRAKAQAEHALADARLAELTAGPRQQEIASAKGQVKTAEADVTQARITQQRVQRMFDQGKAATEQEVAQAEATLQAALGRLEDAQAHLDLLEAGTREEQIAQAKAAVTAAVASVDALDEQLAELTIKSPTDGVVEALDLRPGDLVTPNAPVLTLVDRSELWVRTYVPQSEIGIQLNDKVKVTVDGFPQRQFEGHISFIADQAEFTPRNVQTPEERSKRVFRIKVMLDEGMDVLRPGMTADVWLDGLP